MTDNSVFMVSKIWLKPEMFEQFKIYRGKTLDILLRYNTEYIYHGHPFEWISGADFDRPPTGIEIFHFTDEDTARKALAELNDPSLKHDESLIFCKVRSYLSRYAIAADWKNSGIALSFQPESPG